MNLYKYIDFLNESKIKYITPDIMQDIDNILLDLTDEGFKITKQYCVGRNKWIEKNNSETIESIKIKFQIIDPTYSPKSTLDHLVSYASGNGCGCSIYFVKSSGSRIQGDVKKIGDIESGTTVDFFIYTLN